jgi:hypothetical protein
MVFFVVVVAAVLFVLRKNLASPGWPQILNPPV